MKHKARKWSPSVHWMALRMSPPESQYVSITINSAMSSQHRELIEKTEKLVESIKRKPRSGRRGAWSMEA